MKFDADPPRKWKRKNFDESKLPAPDKVRERSEIETDRDLAKPIEQLLCDVHEEIHNDKRASLENIASAQKRMVSMMARVAISSERLNKKIFLLTLVLTVLTIAILIFTYLMWNGSK